MNAQWIKDQEQELQDLNQMEWKKLTIKQLKSSVTRAAIWKLSDPHKLPTFWFKKFTSLQNHIANTFSHILANPEQASE